MRAFKGDAHSIGSWYRAVIKETLRRIRVPLAITALTIVVGFTLGALQARIYVLPAEIFNFENLKEGISGEIEGVGYIRFFTVGGIFTIWWHNIRTILIATFAGLFSFGVLGVLLMALPFAVIGYFTGAIAMAGISPMLFLTATVLPHGVLEIPAILLAGAAVLKLGATLSAPAPGRTISEALLEALGDWARIMVAMVIPILLGAAILEIYLTPQVVIALFGG